MRALYCNFRYKRENKLERESNELIIILKIEKYNEFK